MTTDSGTPPSALDDFDQQAGLSFDPDAGDRAKLPHNDVGNAERLRMAHGAELLYVPGRGWVVWNGRIWEAEFGETAALRRASTLQKLIEEEAAFVSTGTVPQAEIDAWLTQNPGEEPEKAVKAIRAARKRSKSTFANTCGNVGKINAALTLLRDHCRARVVDLDPLPFRVTARNGELDLDALGRVDLSERASAEDDADAAAVDRGIQSAMGACLHPFARAHLSTRMLGCGFDPAAKAPMFMRFLDAALPEPPMRAFAQRVAGMLLSGRNDAQVALVLLGPGGNGKSTFMNAVARVLGSYAASCRIEMFLEARAVSQGPTPEEAILPGARAYLASEPEPGATLSSSKIKGFTGGERRLAHAKGKDPFEWLPQGVPILSFNKVPRISDESEGMWRRLTFLPFKVYLPDLPPEQRVSPARMERIIEEEASGILNWMIEGWISYRDIGLAPPEEANEIKARQRAMADPIGEFLTDCTAAEPAVSIQASELHRVYEAWCAENGFAPYSIVKFGKTMLDKGHLRVKSNGRNVWRGMNWKAEDGVARLVQKAADGAAS